MEGDLSFWTLKSNTRRNTPTKFAVKPLVSDKIISLGATSKPQHASFFRTYFDFGFYLCITPFCFKRDGIGTGRFVVHKNRMQQVICAVRHILTIFVRITYLRQAFSSQSPKVIYYFEMLQSIAILSYHLAFYNVLWRSEEKFERVVSETENYSSYQKHKSKNKFHVISKATFLCTTATAISIICSFMGYRLIRRSSKRSLWNILESYLHLGEYSLFLQANATRSSDELTDLGQLSWSSIAIIAFQFIAGSSDLGMDFFTSLAALMAAESLLDASECFIHRLLTHEIRTHRFDDVLEHFEKLKDYSVTLNRVVGPLILAYIIDTAIYFSVNLDELLVEPNWFDKLVVLYFIIHDGSLLHSSGLICEEVTKFKTWLLRKEHEDIISSQKMIVVLADLSSNPVALSGNGKFIIDNAFIWMGMIASTILFTILQSTTIIEDSCPNIH